MQRLLHLGLVLCIVSLWNACSFFDNGNDDVLIRFIEDSELDGMVQVVSLRARTTLGTNEASAKSDERPEMQVRFNYVFSMGKHEVTCSEFNSLMKPATGLVLDCPNGNLPATNVTYYDAALYANERSKAANKDTAYIYKKVIFDSEKHCTGMDGFVFNPEADAFRLPTEAEWVFVATQAWYIDRAWTSETSDFKAHPVCSLAEKRDPFCDMAGNATEWVNDWLSFFWDKTVTNYVGAPDGGTLGRRVVKGGSFRNSARTINTYSRGDVYSVTSSTRTDYVGFRLAFGAIPNAEWLGNDGVAQENRVVPLASVATLRSVMGSNKMKLAFRNDISGKLSYIDYSAGMLTVKDFRDTLDVYHPEISPDGKYVAYCSSFEGSSEKSEIAVRQLSVSEDGLVKLKVKGAAIPRWRVLDNGDTVIVYVSDAGDNKDASSFKKKSTWQVSFSNGKFGKPQKLFDGAYHGGLSEDRKLAVSGAKLLRARIAKSGSTVTGNAVDTTWYNGEQACNVSLSTDGKKRTLFLDFGGKTGRNFVGKAYGTHERILVADSSGSLIQSVAAPAGYSFDHAEWVRGRSDYAVATLTNANGAHTKIVLVQVNSGEIVELIEGDELWHPFFWFEPPGIDADKLNLDSAAVYYDGLESRLLSQKMNAFWAKKDSFEVVGLGSSRMSAGFMAAGSTFGYSFNLATIPCDMHCVYYMAKNYVLPHCPNLKVILLSVDLDLWSGKEGTDINLNFASTPGYSYDEKNNFWKDGVPDDFVNLNSSYLENSMELVSMNVFYRGWVGMPSRSWANDGFSENILEGDSTWSDKNKSYEVQIGKLKDLINLAAEKDVIVAGIVFPQSPYYKKTGAFGRHGMRRSLADSLIREMNSWKRIYPNFKFLDENKMGNHGYRDESAYDYDHLSYIGAENLIKNLNFVMKYWRK